MSALSTFLESKKIKPAALLAASNRIESRQPADHALVAARLDAKTNKKEGAAPIAKPKSGRGLSKKLLDSALAGLPITKRARAKALRAAAVLLEKAKDSAPTLKDLFGDEKVKKGESKVGKGSKGAKKE